MSLKVVGEAGLWKAVGWLEAECARKECVVYSAFALPEHALNFHVLRAP